MIKGIIKKIILFLGIPLTILSSLWLKIVRRIGSDDRIFMFFGVFPVRDHFYEPMINPRRHLKKSLREDRKLPGIDLNNDEQLELLSKFSYNEELLEFPMEKRKDAEYYYNNVSYAAGDAEYLYNMIRHCKPKRIIEVGSGYSTMMSANAIKANKNQDPDYQCEFTCIEPFAQCPWLEKMNIKLIRKKVEDIEYSFFLQLEANDILFIDSSHIIRPQGDVLFEYLELLPELNPGVLVHIHDIFTPKDYLDDWIFDRHRLWNEQYLLEAFLSFNSTFKVIGALNYLAHNYSEELKAKCPVFAQKENLEPGSFWLVKK